MAQVVAADFLSGLVTIENAMIALIDLPQLLSEWMRDGADLAGTASPKAA